MSRSEGIRPVKGRHREDEGRVIRIPDDVVDRLRRHLDERPISNIGGFVVTAARGGPVEYGNWRQRVWRRIIEQCGIEATPHDLRRTATTRLFAADRWTPGEVQTFLGHRDPRVTLGIYTIVKADALPQPSSLKAGSV